ncbi:MAG: ATP synthase F1 subunit delta [Candidatus Kapaibacterium sp.]
MTEHRVSSRYAKALLDIAKEQKATDDVYNDLKAVQRIIGSSRELENMLHSPVVHHWQKKKVFEEVFKDIIGEITMKFLSLLADKGREFLIKDIIAEYEQLYNRLNNRLPIGISSAIELNDDLKEKVLAKFRDYTGKTLLPEYHVDESLKGGIKVRVGDLVFDASVSRQLEQLRQRLAGI